MKPQSRSTVTETAVMDIIHTSKTCLGTRPSPTSAIVHTRGHSIHVTMPLRTIRMIPEMPH